MTAFEFALVRETTRSPREVAVALRRAAESRKWGVLGGYDFTEILAAKGYPQEAEIRSLALCAPQFAARLLAGERLVATCMPCHVVILAEGEKTRVAALRPGVVFPHLFAGAPPELAATAREAEAELRAILEEAAG